jgi:hypothetical protein
VQYAQKDPTVPLEVLHDVMGEDRFRQGAEWLLYFEGEEDPYTGAVTLKLNKELELDTPF